MLKPYPNFDLLDDAGGIILAAAILTITLGIPGLFLVGTGPTATRVGIGLLIIPCLLIATGAILFLGSLGKFVAEEAANSIREIRGERQRHLRFLERQQHYEQQAKAKQQQRQVIIELERREHAKRSHSDQVQ